MSTAGGVWRALQRAKQVRAEVCQLFVKNNMQWFGKPHPLEHLNLFADELADGALHCVFGHAGYLINLAGGASAKRDYSLKSLIQELQLAAALKLPFLVLHPGAHLGAGETQGLRQMVAGLNEACATTRNSSVRIALENTAGQGSCLGARLEHLGAIFQQVSHPDRLAVCLDTAHLFAAGFDIRKPRVWNDLIERLSRLVGLQNIVAFHLNDSRTALGSRVDRHAHIGQGEIGRRGFRHIVNDPRFENHPGCLETPKSAELTEDVENLAVLRSLMRRRR